MRWLSRSQNRTGGLSSKRLPRPRPLRSRKRRGDRSRIGPFPLTSIIPLSSNANAGCEAKVRPLGHLDGAGDSLRFHPTGCVDRIAPQVIDELLAVRSRLRRPGRCPFRFGLRAGACARSRPASRAPSRPGPRRGPCLRRGRPEATMYASPIVLIFSNPWSATRPSKRVNTSSRTLTSSSGRIVSDSGVNPTMSANRTPTSDARSAIGDSPAFSRSAIGSGKTFSRSRSERSRSAAMTAAARSRSRTK